MVKLKLKSNQLEIIPVHAVTRTSTRSREAAISRCALQAKGSNSHFPPSFLLPAFNSNLGSNQKHLHHQNPTLYPNPLPAQSRAFSSSNSNSISSVYASSSNTSTHEPASIYLQLKRAIRSQSIQQFNDVDRDRHVSNLLKRHFFISRRKNGISNTRSNRLDQLTNWDDSQTLTNDQLRKLVRLVRERRRGKITIGLHSRRDGDDFLRTLLELKRETKLRLLELQYKHKNEGDFDLGFGTSDGKEKGKGKQNQVVEDQDQDQSQQDSFTQKSTESHSMRSLDVQIDSLSSIYSEIVSILASQVIPEEILKDRTGSKSKSTSSLQASFGFTDSRPGSRPRLLLSGMRNDDHDDHHHHHPPQVDLNRPKLAILSDSSTSSVESLRLKNDSRDRHHNNPLFLHSIIKEIDFLNSLEYRFQIPSSSSTSSELGSFTSGIRINLRFKPRPSWQLLETLLNATLFAPGCGMVEIRETNHSSSSADSMIEGEGETQLSNENKAFRHELVEIFRSLPNRKSKRLFKREIKARETSQKESNPIDSSSDSNSELHYLLGLKDGEITEYKRLENLTEKQVRTSSDLLGFEEEDEILRSFLERNKMKPERIEEEDSIKSLDLNDWFRPFLVQRNVREGEELQGLLEVIKISPSHPNRSFGPSMMTSNHLKDPISRNQSSASNPNSQPQLQLLLHPPPLLTLSRHLKDWLLHHHTTLQSKIQQRKEILPQQNYHPGLYSLDSYREDFYPPKYLVDRFTIEFGRACREADNRERTSSLKDSDSHDLRSIQSLLKPSESRLIDPSPSQWLHEARETLGLFARYRLAVDELWKENVTDESLSGKRAQEQDGEKHSKLEFGFNLDLNSNQRMRSETEAFENEKSGPLSLASFPSPFPYVQALEILIQFEVDFLTSRPLKKWLSERSNRFKVIDDHGKEKETVSYDISLKRLDRMIERRWESTGKMVELVTASNQVQIEDLGLGSGRSDIDSYYKQTRDLRAKQTQIRVSSGRDHWEKALGSLKEMIDSTMTGRVSRSISGSRSSHNDQREDILHFNLLNLLYPVQQSQSARHSSSLSHSTPLESQEQALNQTINRIKRATFVNLIKDSLFDSQFWITFRTLEIGSESISNGVWDSESSTSEFQDPTLELNIPASDQTQRPVFNLLNQYDKYLNRLSLELDLFLRPGSELRSENDGGIEEGSQQGQKKKRVRKRSVIFSEKGKGKGIKDLQEALDLINAILIELLNLQTKVFQNINHLEFKSERDSSIPQPKSELESKLSRILSHTHLSSFFKIAFEMSALEKKEIERNPMINFTSRNRDRRKRRRSFSSAFTEGLNFSSPLNEVAYLLERFGLRETSWKKIEDSSQEWDKAKLKSQSDRQAVYLGSEEMKMEGEYDLDLDLVGGWRGARLILDKKSSGEGTSSWIKDEIEAGRELGRMIKRRTREKEGKGERETEAEGERAEDKPDWWFW